MLAVVALRTITTITTTTTTTSSNIHFPRLDYLSSSTIAAFLHMLLLHLPLTILMKKALLLATTIMTIRTTVFWVIESKYYYLIHWSPHVSTSRTR